MARKRHHFLPRFLLRGFDTGLSSRVPWVYQYRSSADLQHVPVTHVAVAKAFYGSDDIEAGLGKRESIFAPLIAQVRQTGRIPADARSLMAEFFGHLIARTEYTRKGLYEAVSDMLPAFGGQLRGDALRRLLASEINHKSDSIIDDQLRRYGVAPEQVPPAFRSALRNLVLANLDSLVEKARPFVEALLPEIQRQITPDLVANAQRDALKKYVDAQISLRGFGDFEWRVQSCRRLILGDLGLVGVMPDGTLRPWWRAGKDAAGVVLPISHDCLVVGSTHTPFAPIDPEQLNMHTATFCRYFFVASEECEEFRAYARSIGTRARMFELEELDQIARDAVAGVETQGPPKERPQLGG